MPCNATISRTTNKGLDRTAEDLEDAAARLGLTVVGIHDLAPGVTDCRVYEICHAERARETLSRAPEAAILLPCRILLRAEEGGTRLTALSPGTLLRGVPALAALAEEMERTVERTLAEAAR